MIVDYVPVSPPRPDSSASAGPDQRPPGPADDTFGRTLDHVLTADRAGRTDRPTTPERGRPEPAEDRGPQADDHRRDRVDADEDDTQRPTDDERRGVSSDQDRADQVRDQNRSDQPDDDAATDGSRPSTTGVDRAAERLADRLEETPANAEHGLTTALTLLTGVAGDDGVTEAGPAVLEVDDPILVDNPLPTDDDGIDPPVDVPAGVDETEPSDDATADGATDIGGETSDEAPETNDRVRPGGQMVADIARDHQGAGLAETMAEMVDATAGQLGSTSRAAANASPVAAVASAGAQPVTNTLSDDVTADQVTAPRVTAAESTAEESTAAELTEVEAGSNEQTAPDRDELEPALDSGDVPPASADDAPVDAEGVASTLEAPSPAGTEQPVSPPMAVGPNRTSVSAPSATSTAPAPQTPSPELAELQTTGLAERLRPAFAAVRRGLNGLDELRLRIQDDNAGPIKVDIATVDNRVRVLLSVGNDDLMRQLGQERDRLADELRRAGFEQASIDIASDHEGRRRSPYDTEATPLQRRRAGSGGAADTAGTGGLEQAAARRGRQTTGLDLDL